MSQGVPSAGATERETVKKGAHTEPHLDPESERALSLLGNLSTPFWVVKSGSGTSLQPCTGLDQAPEEAIGFIPSLQPQQLGDASFLKDHGLKYAYMAGAMANGIGSAAIVTAMGKAGMLGSFGAAGLDPQDVASAIDQVRGTLDGRAFSFNLIHAPGENHWEDKMVDLFVDRKVSLVEASAYLSLTPAVVRYRTHGIHLDAEGRIATPNRLIAKVSRVEVASKFLAPPPAKILAKLVSEGHLSEHQAQLAAKIPMAQDLSAEADSGGHTDNRPALALLPTMMALASGIQRENPQFPPLRVGLGGGISTPASAAAAFAMGAAFVLTGSVNQACVEAGTSDEVRAMLAAAGQADITMAPAADMFEMGVKLQVLKRGTMFAMRANKLYEFYRNYDRIESLPEQDRAWLEKNIFRTGIGEVWSQTVQFFQQRDPAQIERASRDPKHKMALLFRWYLGQSSNWANRGESSRKIDYQIWCGPAMGAFNEWVRGSRLERPENRNVVAVAENILYGAAVVTRVQQARLQGLALPTVSPSPLASQDLKEYFS